MIIVGEQKPPLEELAHFGVKGMHWGVVRDKTASVANKAKSSVANIDRKKAKKVAIIAGSILAAAVVAAGAVYLSKQMGSSSVGKLRVTEIPKASVATKKFTDHVLHEPSGVIHASRSKHKGFRFFAKGGLNDPIGEWAKNDTGDELGPAFKRYGSRGEKVVGSFLDPLGRKDRSGRVIPHTVILPEHLAKDVHNADDLVKKAWPLVKDDFAKEYET